MALASTVKLRKNLSKFLLDAFDGVLGSEALDEIGRRESFASAHLMAGLVGVALWPLHWALIGPVDFYTGLAFLCLWTPLFLGLWVRGGGALDQGELISSLCLGSFISILAIMTGGMSSPVLPWLLIVPLEAALSRRRQAIWAASGLCCLGFFICAFMSLMGWLPASRLDPALAQFLQSASLFAALVVVTFTLRAFLRRHDYETQGAMRRAELYRSIVDHSADLVTRHLPNGTVIYASPAAQEMLGLTPYELEGLSPAMIVHIQDLRSVEQAMARSLYSPPQTIDFRLRRRDGSYVLVEAKLQAADGEIVAVIRDISQRTGLMEELIDSRDKAEEAGQAKLRFLASVTHELRTPLNAIVGFADMMRNEMFGPAGHPKYREYAEHIRESGLHLVDLVSDLLDMSKIEAGKFTIETKTFEVAPVLNECVSMVRGLADDAGVKLDCDIQEGLMIDADRRALKQCMINLLSNAIKFTLTEGRVHLSAREHGDRVEFVVADSGVGIPEKELMRIGKPFEQVEGGLQHAHKGTGLGLSLVKALTDLHGGEMSIDSALGDGTTVALSWHKMTPRTLPLESETLVFPERFRARA